MVIFFFPQFNFVGRILGPRGLTAKQLEAETGCKIMVRGKGSMRDKKKISLCFPCFDFFGAGGGLRLRNVEVSRPGIKLAP